MKNKKFIHKNGKTYAVTGTCLIQIDNIWKEAVLYTESGELTFCRELQEFLEKFREVE